MITPMTRIALASQRGKTTAVRRGRMPGVGLTRRAGLATGVGRDSNGLIRATNPTHVESIGTVISTKPDRNKKRGGSGMSSNGGSQAATLATLVRVGSLDLTTEDCRSPWCALCTAVTGDRSISGSAHPPSFRTEIDGAQSGDRRAVQI
jgi:hypothetical protein